LPPPEGKVSFGSPEAGRGRHPSMSEALQDNLPFGPKELRRVLARLAEPSPVFTLHVSDGLSERVIYFVGGGVRLLSVGDRSGLDLASHLLAGGVLDVDSLHSALETARTTSRHLREVLIEKQVLSREEYGKIAAKLVRDEMLDLVFWEDAYFACYPSAPPPEIFKQERQAIVGSLDLRSLGGEVGDWSREWSRLKPILHSDTARLSLTDPGRLAIVERDETAQLLELCHEKRELRSVWRGSSLPLGELARRIAELVKRGLLEVSPPAAATTAEARDEMIERLEALLPRVIGKDLVREKLVALYRKTGRPAKAVAELEQLAASAFSAGQWPVAAERLKKILTLAPENLEAFEKVVKIYLDQRLEQEAVALANRHAEVLLELRRPEEARRVAKIIGSLTSANLAASSIQAAALASSGQVNAAAAQYLALAEEYEAAGDPRRAVEMLRHAIALEPDNSTALKKLEALNPSLAKAHGQAPGSGARGGASPARPRAPGPRRAPSPALLALLAVAVVALVLYSRGLLRLPAGVAGSASAPAAEKETSLVITPPIAPPGAAPLAVKIADSAGDSHASGWASPVATASEASRNDPAPRASIPQRPSVERGPAAPFGVAVTSRAAKPARPSPGASLEPASQILACPHPAKHVLERRRPADRLEVVSGTGCELVGYDATTGEALFRLPASLEARWSVGFRAEQVCLWKPGERPLIHEPASGAATTLSWEVPEDCNALAIGRNRIALRRKQATTLLDHAGNVLAGGNLPPWDEGLFAGEMLLVAGPSLPQDERTLWVIDVASWRILWSCRREGGGFAIR
jgi:tetratricopeptide (TPR) repeat protein